MENVTMFVNDKERYHTSNAQTYCLNVGLVLLTICNAFLHYSRRVYYGKIKLPKKAKRRCDKENDEREPLIKI